MAQIPKVMKKILVQNLMKTLKIWETIYKSLIILISWKIRMRKRVSLKLNYLRKEILTSNTSLLVTKKNSNSTQVA
jgi:hypothetical protein